MTTELKKKGWPGEPTCKLCGEPETSDHLVFGCPLSHFVWWWIAGAMGWERPPLSANDFVQVALKRPGSQANYLGWAIVGAVAWSLWLTRNDFVFNKRLCGSPTNITCKIVSFLSQWKLLVPARREDGWASLLERLKTQVSKLHFMARSRGGIG